MFINFGIIITVELYTQTRLLAVELHKYLTYN
jgi:hypothetical protein